MTDRFLKKPHSNGSVTAGCFSDFVLVMEISSQKTYGEAPEMESITTDKNQKVNREVVERTKEFAPEIRTCLETFSPSARFMPFPDMEQFPSPLSREEAEGHIGTPGIVSMESPKYGIEIVISFRTIPDPELLKEMEGRLSAPF